MAFQNLEYLLGLLLLVPITLLFVFLLRWKRKVRKQIGDEDLVKSLVKDYSPKYFRLKFFVFIAALALCVIGAANLRKPKAGASGNKAGIDVMVVLDVSNSMLAQDIKPNRLERAKQVLNKLVDQLEDNRMGLVVFAGQAFLQMPLTADLASAKMFISNASPSAVPVQGTVIGDALRLANASLDTKERKYKAVILVTDGEDHDEKVEAASDELAEFGVVVHAIGIGSPDGAPIFDEVINDYKKDLQGNVVVSKLNEKDLQLVAQKTGGEYVLFNSPDEVVTRIMNELNQMDKKQVGGGEQRSYDSYFQWFLLVALVLLLVEVFIPERRIKWFGAK
ncbi:VWA domain-containing protein [Aridibaculum aurantiacum]|uniref:VWA domain-containing protein n=1 Tax=Aridibaculum aurantiacum TaxID=2810307 RepID=UPI001A96F981|nr:VWA domain-containing protein [Aridibaculum aurantiacum]